MGNYVIAQDGVRVRLESSCLEGWVEPKTMKELQTYATKPLDKDRYHGPRWTGSKMPAALLKQVLGTIHEFPRMETAFSLYYNAREHKWAVKCPEQSGQGAAVSFYDDGTGMPDGFTLCGSIHTHPEMGAFWSGTDLNDQQFKAGIHIVFGLRNGFVHEHKCTVFLPNTQEDQDLWSVVENVDFTQIDKPVDDWVATIKRQSYHRPAPATTYWYGGGYWYNPSKKLPPGHYGSYNHANSQYAGYSYTYGYPYRKKPKTSWYSQIPIAGHTTGRADVPVTGGSVRNYGGGWDDDYDYDYGGYEYGYGSGDLLYDSENGKWYDPTLYTQKPKDSVEEPATATVEATEIDCTDLRNAIIAAIEDNDAAPKLATVLLDNDVRGPLEHLCGVCITDICDKDDALMTIEDLMTGESPLATMNNEEAVQIFEGLLDLKPDLQVIDSGNATGNDINIDSLCVLMEHAANAFEEANCVSEDTVRNWVASLYEVYSKVTTMASKYGIEIEYETEGGTTK